MAETLGAKIAPVDSKKKMLTPQDIFVVAAHEYKDGLEAAKDAAKKAKVTPERMSYTVMIREYSDPRLLRVRNGNTLFTIAALPRRIGFVRGYNGDTAQNYVDNIVELISTSRKLGFDFLLAHVTDAAAKAVKLAVRRLRQPEITTEFNPSQEMLVIKTGDIRGE